MRNLAVTIIKSAFAIVAAATIIGILLYLGSGPAPDGVLVDGVPFKYIGTFLLYRYGVMFAGLGAFFGGAFVMMAAYITAKNNEKENDRAENREFVGIAGAIAGEVQVLVQTLNVCATRLHTSMVEAPDDETVRKFVFEKLVGFAPKSVIYPSVADKIGHLGPGLANDVVIFYSMCKCLDFDNMRGAGTKELAARGRALVGTLRVGAKLHARLDRFAKTYFSDSRSIDGAAAMEDYEAIQARYGDESKGRVDPDIWPRFVKGNESE